MPYRRTDSPVWWISYRLPDGTRVRRSAETTDRREAEAIEGRYRAEAHRAKHWGESAPTETAFEAVMLAFLKDRATKRSAATDRYRARHLRAHFKGTVMERLDKTHIRSYVETRRADGVTDTTINRELALLSAAINHAKLEMDLNLPNPVRGRLMPEPDSRTRWIDRATASALIAAAERAARMPFLADFIVLALYTGCRKEELLGLEWGRVDLRDNLIHLEARHTKANKRRSIPLCGPARAALVRRAAFRAEHCPDAPWVFVYADGRRTRDVRHAFATACAAAGIDDFRVHDLRHTCAAWMVTAGVPLAEIRDLLGHSTVAMTEKYAHLAPENLRAAVERLEGVCHDPVTPAIPLHRKRA